MTPASAPASTETALEDAFGTAPAPITVASAPGRVNLIGGHTDYNDGFVLPMAIDRRHEVALRPREDRTLAVRSLNFGETRTASLDALEPSDDRHWSDYVMGVAAMLQDRGHTLGGADLVVDGKVPMGAGFSSSAAFEVAVTTAFDAAFTLGLEPDEVVRISRAAENDFVGVSCGIMDQYTAVHAAADRVLFVDCQDVTHELLPLPSTEVAVLATDTCVQRGLVESAYNDRVDTCTSAAAYFDDVLDHDVDSLRDVSRDDFEAHADGLSETARKRVRHVIAENDRVRAARDALADGEFATLGSLIEASHESLRDDYEVSIEELDTVVEAAADVAGVYGSRMTGGGFGGSVITLVDPGAVSAARSAIEETYTDATGIDPETYVFTAGEGSHVHDGA